MKTTATAAAEQVVHIYKPLIRRRKKKKTDKKIKSSEMGKFILMIVLLCLSLLVVVAYGSSSSSSEEKIGIYELKKGNMSLRVTNYGAHVISLVIPDKYGKLKDVILGYDTAVAYKQNDTTNFGATVGRVANRIGGAQFTLNGTLYKLVPNEGNNILHGGPVGFGKVVWKVKDYQPNASRPFIVFQYKSPDGDQGFPGDVVALVKYTLMEHRQLSIKMKARALNKATPVNLANHAYWNLAGHDSGDILSHELQIFASHYTPVNDHLIPTGKIDSVVRTPYDFITPKSKAAVVHDTKSGRVMELFTNQPGVQLYTSGQLVDTKGKGGVVYKKHGGLCLETQGYPDAVNHPNFPSTIVTPSNPYHHSMLLRFSTS
ncbi:Galactose mutarotase [Linum perenne]